jgi:hypothetical protein
MQSELSDKAETPTGSAVRHITDELVALDLRGPKFIILATDGEPDTCLLSDPQCGQDESIAAIQEARALGIGTFVVGIGNEVGAMHLADLANAGAGLPVLERAPAAGCEELLGEAQALYENASNGEPVPEADYYQPEDEAELQASLERIIGGVKSCTFEMDAEVDLGLAYLGNVELDAEALSYQGPDGWRLVSTTQIEILGQACERITLDQSQDLSIRFPCAAAVAR